MSNTITLTGRLAADPELRFTASGKAVCQVTIPDQKRTKNDRGEWEDASATTWVRASVWGEQGEALAESARKGDEVVATGRLISREWTDKDGATRTSLELDFAKVGVVPRGRPAERSSGQQAAAGDPWQAPQQSGGGFGDEAPF